MKSKLLLMALFPAFLLVQGCVVVVGTGSDDGVYWAGDDHAENGVAHDGDALSRDVARLLGRDASLATENIRVSSEDGVVVLKGHVANVYLLARALETARTVEGVVRVVSEVSVDAG